MSENTNDTSTGELSSSLATPQLAPITAARRIDAMDVIRGLALAGILLMNIEWFGRSIEQIGRFDTTLTGLDHAFGWLIRCFVEGKFYKLFALLFGMGFAVMLIRAREIGKPFGAWFTRRMVVLFVIGLLHMIFLWGGDILHDYAFAGLLFLGWIYLFQTKRLKKFDKPESFLKIALVWLTVPFVVGTIMALGFGVRFDNVDLTEDWQKDQYVDSEIDSRTKALPPWSADETEESDQPAAADSATDTESEPEDQDRELTEAEETEETINRRVENRRKRLAREKEEVDTFSHGTYWEATKVRFRHVGTALTVTPFFTLVMLLPIFLLGYWLIASGTLRNHQDNRHIFKPMALIGMTFGMFFTVGGLSVMQHPVADVSRILQIAGGMLFFFGQYVLAAGYLGSVVLLLSSPAWSKRLDHFAPMGRMALTNYIMHSIILTTIFYGYAGGFYGQVSRAPQMLIVIAIIVFQLFFSRWWLERYRFGPLEWVWRSLTYKTMQPMKITP